MFGINNLNLDKLKSSSISWWVGSTNPYDQYNDVFTYDIYHKNQRNVGKDCIYSPPKMPMNHQILTSLIGNPYNILYNSSFTAGLDPLGGPDPRQI